MVCEESQFLLLQTPRVGIGGFPWICMWGNGGLPLQAKARTALNSFFMVWGGGGLDWAGLARTWGGQQQHWWVGLRGGGGLAAATPKFAKIFLS